MIDGLVAGRLFGDAEVRMDKGGNPFVVAKVRASGAEVDNVFVNIIAFDSRVSTVLQKLRDGDSVALAGELTPKVWTDKQGNTRPALDMVAHRIVSTYNTDTDG